MIPPSKVNKKNRPAKDSASPFSRDCGELLCFLAAFLTLVAASAVAFLTAAAVTFLAAAAVAALCASCLFVAFVAAVVTSARSHYNGSSKDKDDLFHNL